jgi:hypothetical protein
MTTSISDRQIAALQGIADGLQEVRETGRPAAPQRLVIPEGATWTGTPEEDMGLLVSEPIDLQRDGYGQGYSTSDPALLVSGHRIDAVQTTSEKRIWFLRCLAPHKRCEPLQGRHVDSEGA